MVTQFFAHFPAGSTGFEAHPHGVEVRAHPNHPEEVYLCHGCPLFKGTHYMALIDSMPDEDAQGLANYLAELNKMPVALVYLTFLKVGYPLPIDQVERIERRAGTDEGEDAVKKEEGFAE